MVDKKKAGESELKSVESKVTGFLETKAKQEVHHIVCLNIGGRLRWIEHRFIPSTDQQFEFKKGKVAHTFGIDTKQQPLFEDEKARPVYLSILGSFGPASVNGDIQLVTGPAKTDLLTIVELANQESDVHNKAYEQGQAEAILSAGTRNQLQNPTPIWMQFLAFGGIPIGLIIGIIIAPYIGKALGGG